MTTLYAVQGDNNSVRRVVLTQTIDQTPLNLTGATAVSLKASGPRTFSKACTFVADASGVVTVTLLAADVASPGRYEIEWQVTYGDGTVITIPDPDVDVLIVRQQRG